MSKFILNFFLGFFCLFFAMCASNAKSSKTSEEFKIKRGVNVSHWLSQSKKRGEERKNYITKADFDTIASVGFDHVRIPIDEEQMWNEKGNKEKEAFGLLHNAIKWALAANLRVIVDLHIIRSHYFLAENNPLWTDPAEQEKLIYLWQQLSEELKKYPINMVAYEILNEVVAEDPDDWNNLISKAIAKIRLNEPERTIVVGSNQWQIASTFPDLEIPEGDTNIILSFHFYNPIALTHHMAPWSVVGEYKGDVNYPGQILDTTHYKELSAEAVTAMREHANGYFTKDTLAKIMSPAIEIAKEKKLPLYCGEFGIYPTIPEEIALRWYKDVCDIFNSNNIAYSHWCYKGDFPIVDENSKPNKKLVSVLTSR